MGLTGLAEMGPLPWRLNDDTGMHLRVKLGERSVGGISSTGHSAKAPLATRIHDDATGPDSVNESGLPGMMERMEVTGMAYGYWITVITSTRSRRRYIA